MFNAPRPSQRYGGGSSNGFGSSTMTDSFAASDPLANSAYDGLDPWSSTPSPVPPPPPAAAPSGFASVIADATVPQIYHSAFSAVDPTNSGETSVNALSRVLGTSNLPASMIDRIVSLVTSSRSRVTKLEFFVALALVALAQSGKDLSIEQVASLASANNLPEPTLALAALPPSYSGMSAPTLGNQGSTNFVRSPAPAYSSDDPWATYGATTPGFSGPAGREAGTFSIGAPSGVSGTGLPRDWWKRQEKVTVTALGQQGFILNRYMVYEISSERGATVSRRYSEFVFLWDCLVRRYPFRILPQLPPKRVGPDDNFIEQRRKGLTRFLNYVVNHPIIKEDGILSVFLSEPSLENWRKHASVSLEEESASKRIDSVEEMSIPRDLEEKLGIMRGKIGNLIEQWQKICILAERLVRRREAAAVRNPNALFKRSFISAYFTPSVSMSSSTSSLTPSVASSPTREHSIDSDRYSTRSNPMSYSTPALGGLASSIARLPMPSSPLVGSSRPDGSADGGFYTSHWTDPQADLSRMTLTINVLNEVNERCWRGDDCELCEGVRNGFGQVSAHLQRHADELDTRAKQILSTTLESLKAQRDLYIAVRDLFIRHDRLSGDQVERLKKRVETNGLKMEGIRAAQKEGWQNECDKLQSMVERDQATIAAQLNRRVFIRHSMWHELRVVLHNRENALITQAVKIFASQESVYSEAIANNWQSLNDAVENMPYE